MIPELYQFNTNYNLDELSIFLADNSDKSYLLNTDLQNPDILEKYIYDTVSYNLTHLKLSSIQNYSVEFKILTNLNANKYSISCDNTLGHSDLKYPIMSVLTNMSEKNLNFILTDVNFNQYKFKHFNHQDVLQLFYIHKHTSLIFDSSKYHGFYESSIDDCDHLALLISVYPYKRTGIPIYLSNNSKELHNINYINESHIKYLQDKQTIKTDFLNYDFFNKLLYKNTIPSYATDKICELKLSNAYHIILQPDDTDITVNNNMDITNKDESKDEYDYSTDKRFIQRFIHKELFTPYLCNWIKKEFDAVNNIITDSNNVLEITQIPNIQSFIFNNIEYIFDKINNFYCKTLPTDINYIKFVKYKVFKEQPTYNTSSDTSTFIIQVRILNSADGGNILFNDDISTHLHTGDMITHLMKDKCVKTDLIRGEIIDMIIAI